MDRIKEILKRVEKSDNLLFFDRSGIDSLKKITKTTKVSDYEVLTDNGWVDVKSLHETIPYEVYRLKLSNGSELKCADNHIVFNEHMEETFVKDLSIGDRIFVQDGTSIVIELEPLGYKEVMYDLELDENSDRRYYTNGILSHNTYLAKLLAEYLFESEDSLIRIDMSEYMEKHSISRLIGAPPGYVGHEEGGQLTEKVRKRPYSVILFDEIEKAHPDTFNIMLQMLDDGQMTDGLGRKINFKNCLILMTSNIGIRQLQDFGTGVGFSTKNKTSTVEEDKKSIIDKELKKKFAPEFINRLDDIVIFNSLNQEDVIKIVDIELNKLAKRIKEIGYNLKVTDSVKEYIAKEGYDEKFGARPLNRAIQKFIEDPISEEVLKGEIKENDTIKLNYDKNKEKIIIKISKSKN